MNAEDLRATAADIRNAVDGVAGSEFELAVADWLDVTAEFMEDTPAGLATAHVREQTVRRAFAVVKAWRGES